MSEQSDEDRAACAALGPAGAALFDPAWYLARNPDVAAAGEIPILHYLRVGAAEGRDPNPLFDGAWYKAQNPEVAAAGIDPLRHYVESGAGAGRNPHPLFDTSAYLAVNTDVAAGGFEPLAHFLRYGAGELRDPHPLFWSGWYREQNPDLPDHEIPILHYLRIGAAEGRDPNPLFDGAWYRAQNPEVGAAGIDPLRHYIETGAGAGRNPHPLFDTSAYLAVNTDVAAGGSEPLAHFLRYGAGELRDPHPLFWSGWYREQNPDLPDHEIPILHYLRVGANEGRDPNPFFDGAWYRARNPAARAPGIHPLRHYVEIGAPAGHDPSPDFDAGWYARVHGEAGVPLAQPLVHYLRTGRARQWPVRPVIARHPVAVVFLARSADGSTAGLDRFLRSYRAFSAGMPHDLVVLRKGGTRKPGAKEALGLMLDGLDPQYVDLDDWGYDLQAYLRASTFLPHEFVCFLNSHSEIMADAWLRKLYEPLRDPAVGIVGATASYESITDTIDLGAKAVWLAEQGAFPSDPEAVALFRSHLAVHAPGWRPGAPTLDGGDLAAGSSLDREIAYARHWSTLTRPGGALYPLGGFRRFPNPHVRTNGFVMRRAVLLGLGVELNETKMSCVLFESAPGGLPDLLAARGLEAVLVGADGAAFGVERWAESNTFRLGDQGNILIRDNRVAEFDAFDPDERRRYVHFTWGAYERPTPEALTRLGFPFGKTDLAREPRERPGGDPSPPTIAIAIPSHDRMHLVRDALTTIVGQSYAHWTCVVFDNASGEPVREMVAAFDEPRITYARSDAFLPVTESWNRAIDLAKGDYVILLGDDDGLTPRGLETIAATIRAFEGPDLLYSALYQFFHPGVAPWEPSGYVSRRQNGFFFDDRTEPFRLDPAAARLAVAGSLGFRRNFTYNMQAFVFRRAFLERLRRDGRVFQSPFPDYYLANVAMALAHDVVVMPEPISIQGVSRKSFGFTLLNNEQDKGDSLLATDLTRDPLYGRLAAYALPGPSYDLKYALTMEHVAEALGARCPAPVDIGRYRRLQIFKALGEADGLLGAAGAMPEAVRTGILPGLSREEAAWVEALLRAAARAAGGDAESRSELAGVAADVAMYAPAAQAVTAHSGWAGDFAALPALFHAMRVGRIAAWVERLSPEDADRAA